MRRTRRDIILLTPTGCPLLLIAFDRWRLTQVPHHYQYQYASSATMRSSLWGGVTVMLTDARGGAPARIRLPARWRDRRAIAQQIIDDVTAYQQAHAPAGASLTDIVLAYTPSAVGAPPHFCAVASRKDMPLVDTIQHWLAGRGMQMAEMQWSADHLLLPTARGAGQSRFVLIFASPQVLASEQCQSLAEQLLRQGSLVIPIQVTQKRALPPYLAALQWVDFSAAFDRSRSKWDLYNTLDRAGIPIASPEVIFDGELAQARAMHQRVPANWQVFRPHTSDRAFYSSTQLSARTVKTRLPWIVAFLLVVVVVVVVVGGGTLLWYGLGMGAVVVALNYGWGFLPGNGSARRFYQRLATEYYAPECIVVTPEGMTLHVVDLEKHAFIDYSCAFTQISTILMHKNRAGVSELHITPRNGSHIIVPLPYFYEALPPLTRALAKYAPGKP